MNGIDTLHVVDETKASREYFFSTARLLYMTFRHIQKPGLRSYCCRIKGSRYFYRIIFFSFSSHLGQSPDQKEIIKNLPKNKALFVEGAFRVWLKKSQVRRYAHLFFSMVNAKPLFQVNYFILRGEAVPRPPPTVGDVDDTTKIKNWLHGENEPHDLVRYV